jgi:hypothetical protein
MSDESYEDFDDVLPEEPSGELVHWMEPRPLSVGAAGITLAVAGGFVLGMATALIVVGLSRVGGPERRMTLPLQRKLRRFS